MADLVIEHVREVWVRENAIGVPQQSALHRERVYPNHEQWAQGHKVVRYVPALPPQPEPSNEARESKKGNG